MQYKSCSKCGKIHPQGFQCSKGRVYSGGSERKLRSTYAWTEKSKEIKAKANYLCEVCRDQGIFTYKNLETHHIIKLTEDETKLLDDDNLICLCQEHHTLADNGNLSKEYLTELARKREGEGMGESTPVPSR